MHVSSWAGRIAAAATTGLLSIGLAGAAQAATTSTPTAIVWVNGSAATVGGDGTSCTAPGFSTIQSAVDAAPDGAQINICAGTYAEQVVITKSLKLMGTGGPVTITLPASPVDDSTYCSGAVPSSTPASSPPGMQYGVNICGPVTVTLSHLTVHSAWPAGTCNDSLDAVNVGGGAMLYFLHSAVTAAGASPINGCQGGIGILVTFGHVRVEDSTVSGYQKNGITLKGEGVTGVITQTKVMSSPTGQIAQNGIEVAYGAKAHIWRTTVTGNECNYSTCGPDAQADYQSTGILFYLAAPGSVVGYSTASGNDIGVYTLSDSSTQAVATLKYDTFKNNRYENVVFDQGKAIISHSVVSGGNVGLMLLQYNGQSTGINGVGSYDTFGPSSVYAVQAYSDAAASGDLPGSMVASHSVVHGSVGNNSPSYAPVTITIH